MPFSLLLPQLRFLAEYLVHPRTVGAVLLSSGRLARKIADKIDFRAARCIVEFGPGNGVFKEELLARRDLATRPVVVERNDAFMRYCSKGSPGSTTRRPASSSNPFVDLRCAVAMKFLVPY